MKPRRPVHHEPGVRPRQLLAHVRPARHAEAAAAAVGEPAQDDMVAGVEPGDARADGLDDARAFVPEDRRARMVVDAVDDVEVGVADAARRHPDRDLARTGSVDLDVLHPEGRTGLVQNRRPHAPNVPLRNGQPVGAASDGRTVARDRAGGDPARLRVRVRAARASPIGGDRRPEPACARPSPAGDPRRARADVRQVRPAPLDPPGHRPGRDHRRAAPAPGRCAAVPLRRGGADDRGGPAARRSRSSITSFDPVPVAAASIGQVHLAELPSRRLVAVKVQRPGAARQIERDLALLYQVARIVKRRVDRLDFIDPVAVVDEFARSIRRELDYRIEARTAEIFRQNFAVGRARHHPEGLRHLLQRPGADARAAGGHPARRPRPRRDADGRAPPARDPDRRDVARDDLPPRPLPRRPAPGEHLRDPGRPARPRRLRHDRLADRRRHAPPHPAPARRGERERRRAAPPAL